MKSFRKRLLVIGMAGMLAVLGTGILTVPVKAVTQSSDSTTMTRAAAEQEITDYATIIKLKVSDEIAEKIDETAEKYIKVLKKKDSSGAYIIKDDATSTFEECVTEAKAAIDLLVPSTDDTSQTSDTTDSTPSSTSDFVMVGGNWVTPTATYGQYVNVVLPVVNMGSVSLSNIEITPVISNLVTEWPFEIETSGYTQTITDLPAKGNGQSDMDRRRELTWTFKTRGDALSGCYKLQFNVLYLRGTETESATLTTYVNVAGATGSGTVEGEGSGTSMPRVIVTGFETDPAKVYAGDTFTLTLHLKNTSQRTDVSNMLVNITAPSEGTDADSTYSAFLPTSGSNSEYIAMIKKGATADLSIEMTAKADLTQKPYAIDVSMDYEDDNYTAYNSTANVSLPVHQDAKFELSTPEILPASISVGNESDIMFSIYNTGKTTLYNVQVSFEGDSIEGGDSFIGKIEAGGTGSVDAMVTGKAPTTDDGTIKAVITYEDESGNQSKYEQEMTLNVTQDILNEDMSDMAVIDYEEEDTGSSRTVVIVVLVLVVILVVSVVLYFVLRKRKKIKAQKEMDDLLEDEGEDIPDEIS